jgi:hypothetical protein
MHHPQGTEDDDCACGPADAWHRRLVRYYSFFGFRRVRAVGDSGLRDIPDLLAWGGVGMRMDADIEPLLTRCARACCRLSWPLVSRARWPCFALERRVSAAYAWPGWRQCILLEIRLTCEATCMLERQRSRL